MDDDFQLFTQVGTDQDSVLYRGGPTGYRLAQVEPHPERLACHSLAVTASERTAPVLTTDEAVQRTAALYYPFPFHLDGPRPWRAAPAPLRWPLRADRPADAGE